MKRITSLLLSLITLSYGAAHESCPRTFRVVPFSVNFDDWVGGHGCVMSDFVRDLVCRKEPRFLSIGNAKSKLFGAHIKTKEQLMGFVDTDFDRKKTFLI